MVKEELCDLGGEFDCRVERSDGMVKDDVDVFWGDGVDVFLGFGKEVLWVK